MGDMKGQHSAARLAAHKSRCSPGCRPAAARLLTPLAGCQAPPSCALRGCCRSVCRMHAGVLTLNLCVPFCREICLLHGLCDVDRSTLLARLAAGPGSAVFLAVGGAAESLLTQVGVPACRQAAATAPAVRQCQLAFDCLGCLQGRTPSVFLPAVVQLLVANQGCHAPVPLFLCTAERAARLHGPGAAAAQGFCQACPGLWGRHCAGAGLWRE